MAAAARAAAGTAVEARVAGMGVETWVEVARAAGTAEAVRVAARAAAEAATAATAVVMVVVSTAD